MRRRPWSIAAASVAAGAIAPALAACGGGGQARRRTLRVPARDAGPRQVVAAYVAALSAHDIATAKALMTSGFAHGVESAVDSRFTNTLAITHLRMGAVEPGGDHESARRYRYVLYVPVEFDLRQRRQVSMRDGEAVWGYVLVRNSGNARWLIDEDGVE
jgi:hypothetical protein